MRIEKGAAMKCIHFCGHCEDNKICPYFTTALERCEAFGSVGELQKAAQKERQEYERLKKKFGNANKYGLLP